MNKRRIFFSGIITSAIGVGLGLVIVEMAPTPYKSSMYCNLKRGYLIIEGVSGLLLGSSQETIRQLKRQCDQDEVLAHQCHKTDLVIPQTESSDGHINGHHTIL